MRRDLLASVVAGAMMVVGIGFLAFRLSSPRDKPDAGSVLTEDPTSSISPDMVPRSPVYEPRLTFDSSGFSVVGGLIPKWDGGATLDEIATLWTHAGHEAIRKVDLQLERNDLPPDKQVELGLMRAILLHYEAEPYQAYDQLLKVRELVAAHGGLAKGWMATVVYLQGVTAFRCGETDNCIHCRGEGSCIFPISRSAVHTNPHGSRLAVQHFSEYLEWFPDDQAVRWLLNLAHMTLGEHPHQVDPRFLIEDRIESEFAIGEFREIGDLVGVNRFNQAGGAIMDDFDNDLLLDIVTTSFDPTQSMSFLRNDGKGRFREATRTSGLIKQLGGLYCVQADFNNDGFIDIYVPRGAWLLSPIRPTLLQNNGDGTFLDVTREAGMLDPVNSNSAAWGDFDNDGNVDLYVCCERQPNRLLRSRGNGTFEEIAKPAGVQGSGAKFCKGATWLDFDNDNNSDLFITYYQGTAQLLRNEADGSFRDVTNDMGIDGPAAGFSCWSWDYDNDGWLDIFATCYDLQLEAVAAGWKGEPHQLRSNRLFRNDGGKRFIDRTREAGLDHVYGTMGSNFGDFDNDGFPDMYLGTGEPRLETLIPNRMLRNIEGEFFADITASSRTGHLQKGHGVSCGDWNRDGQTDLFVETGGAGNGDRFHNVLFHNPGHSHAWLSIRLSGTLSNRSAFGARISVITEGDRTQTIHRHVTTGSSFGANPLEQHIGLGSESKVSTLEIYWPASQTTQVFHDIAVNQHLHITENEPTYRIFNIPPIPLPEE